MNRILTTLALTMSLCACRSIDVSVDDAIERARFFDTFTIKGAGSERHIETAAAHGANTIRTWAVRGDGGSLKMLDKAHRLGLKVILGVWMPPLPADTEKPRKGIKIKYNYAKRRDSNVQKMQRLLDLYDDHPALLIWGLGNHAPAISRATINKQYGIKLSFAAKSDVQVHVDVKDAEDDPLQFKYWIFKTKERVRGKKVSDPYVGTADIEINAPANTGEYTLLIYAIDEQGKASSHQVPFIVE